MPEITLLGWFHTALGIFALLSGVYALARYKVMAFSHLPGKLYLICTLVVALSALGIYNQGGFGIAHVLAILTLLAVLVGAIAEKTNVFRQFSPYLQAVSYSATFLFHMIPAITDGLRRLPVDDPVITTFEDPLLGKFFMAFLVIYVIGVALQMLYLRKQ